MRPAAWVSRSRRENAWPAASLGWSTETAGLLQVAARGRSRRTGREDDVKPGRSCLHEQDLSARWRPSRNCRCVAACWITWFWWTRRSAADGPAHGPRSQPSAPAVPPPHGERDSGGGLRTDRVLQNRRQPGRGRHDLHGQFADGAGGRLRTARLQRRQGRLRSVRREREQRGSGRRALLRRAARKPGPSSGDKSASGRRRSAGGSSTKVRASCPPRALVTMAALSGALPFQGVIRSAPGGAGSTR